MDYLLTGCRQATGLRVYAFDAVASNRERSECTVSIDTALMRKYGIALQDLPLICRQLLETHAAPNSPRNLTFTEGEMAGIAAEREETQRQARERRFNRGRPAPRAAVNAG